MTKKDRKEFFEEVAKILENLPPPPTPIMIQDTQINMTDEAEKEMAIAAGKLADAIKALAERQNGRHSTGIHVGPMQP
jgi:hypothetical protein